MELQEYTKSLRPDSMMMQLERDACNSIAHLSIAGKQEGFR